MNDFEKDQVIQWYEWREEQLLDIMKTLPPAPKNLKSYSPRLASLILDACGLLDSILRQITPDPVRVDGEIKKRNNLDIKDYATLYSTEFNLPKLKSILLIHPPNYRCPFEPWASISSGGDYEPLPWWQTYNGLKHDRIAHMKSAGLDKAIDALCALHQVIAVVPKLRSAVFGRGWINIAGRDPKMLLDAQKSKTINNLFICLVESKLFVVSPHRQFPFPENIKDFGPARYFASERVTQFFGRWL